MVRDEIKDEYFEWLLDFVCRDRYSPKISYRKLLMYLHNTDFRYLLERDQNRSVNGVYLRYRFVVVHDYDDYIFDEWEDQCSVLEMMIALAIECEESTMDDPSIGNRTGQWFWGMIRSLGLSSMTDDRFDRRLAEDVVETFLDREYEPDGRGGLFTIRNCDKDLRDVEIFYQLCWYLDSIT